MTCPVESTMNCCDEVAPTVSMPEELVAPIPTYPRLSITNRPPVVDALYDVIFTRSPVPYSVPQRSGSEEEYFASVPVWK